MNLAFPAIFIFLLLLPGLLFHYLFQNRDAQAADLTPFGSTSLHIAFFSLFFNLIGMGIAYAFFGYRFYFGTILNLLVNHASNQSVLLPVFQRLDNHPHEPLLYFSLTSALALLCALIWRCLVNIYQLDHPSCRFYQQIRPRAPWYYLFKGVDAPQGYTAVDCTVISAVVTLKDCAYIYTGILVDYELTEKGELDRLVLSSAARRKLSDDRNPQGEKCADNDHRFYPIDGDYFVLHAEEYTTLNIRYLSLIEPQAISQTDETSKLASPIKG